MSDVQSERPPGIYSKGAGFRIEGLNGVPLSALEPHILGIMRVIRGYRNKDDDGDFVLMVERT